jgi:pimeloyl-ACP methyl ester carboxylesterase
MSPSVQRPDAHELSAKPSLVDVGDAAIAYHAIGSGPPLLLLHGWPLHGGTFRRILPALAAHHTCYVIDFPGAGSSRWTDRTAFGMGAQAEGVKAFASRMGLRSYSIVSHDTGGTIGRQLAIIDADRVNKLVAIGTEIPHHRPPWIRLFQFLSYLPGADAGFRANMGSDRFLRSSRGFGGCFSNLDLIGGEFHHLFVQPLLESAERRGGQRGRLRGIDWALLDRLAEGHAAIRAPVLLLWGANDPVFPAEQARKMVPQFNDARFVTIPDAKLFVHEERPDEVARECLSFLGAPRS